MSDARKWSRKSFIVVVLFLLAAIFAVMYFNVNVPDVFDDDPGVTNSLDVNDMQREAAMVACAEHGGVHHETVDALGVGVVHCNGRDAVGDRFIFFYGTDA